MDRVLASGARDESSTLSGGTIGGGGIPPTPLYERGEKQPSNPLLVKRDEMGDSHWQGRAFGAAAETAGRGPAVGRLVWDQEVGSSILPAPTRYGLGVSLGSMTWPKMPQLQQLLQQPNSKLLFLRHKTSPQLSTWGLSALRF